MGQLGEVFFGTSAQSAKSPGINTWRLMQSTQGAVISIVYGSQRVPVEWIWAGDYHQKGGGSDKGAALFGKGGSTIQYRIGAALGLCSGAGLGVYTGQAIGVGRAWQSGNGNQLITTYGVAHQWITFSGLDGQAPWGYLVTNHPESAFGFSGLAYVATSAWNLGSSPNPPQISFEVYGLGMLTGLNVFAFGAANGDCWLSNAFIDLWLNTEIGIGAPSNFIGTSQPGWTGFPFFNSPLSEWANFIAAAGMWVSPLLDRQQPFSKWVQDFLDITMSDLIVTCEALYVRPYTTETITGDGVPDLFFSKWTYTPLVVPLVDLTDNDYLKPGQGQPPVNLIRQLPQDRYNEVKIEYVNRANNYNVEIIHAKLQSQIDQFLYRPAQVQRLHHITRPDVAMKTATMMLYKLTQDVNRYEFSLHAGYIWLEVLDVVSITDSGLGLDKWPVRIVKIEEDDKRNLKFTCSDLWTCAPDNYFTQPTTSRSGQDSGQSTSQSVNTPVIFEPPPAISLDTVQVWVAVSNPSNNYGGCGVWVSYDGGVSYTRVGVCAGSNQQGSLTGALAAHAAGLDSTNVLEINISNSGPESSLTSISGASAAAFQNLAFVGGELLSFQTATLTGPEVYNLTSLYRGAYGTNPGSHSVGVQFAFLSSAAGGAPGLFMLPLTADKVGTTLHFKFTAFNLEGAQEQDVSTVTAYPYTVTGAGLAPILIPFPFPGVPSASQTLTFLATQAVVLPSGLATSTAKAGTAATGSTTFTIKHNGSSVGTIVFAPSGTIGTFTFATTVNLAVGDTLQVVAPAVADVTLADINILIEGAP